MKRALLLLLVLSVIFAGFAGAVKITYWQYYYETKVKLVDQLIEEFEKQNPGIEVEHVTFPYENFNEKVAVSVPAGVGPDVLTLFYGWIPLYVTSGYLVPLPEAEFSPEYLSSEFFPFVSKGIEFDGIPYALPTAVRSLALFWNKDLFAEAGLDPESPPTTFEEMVEFAKKLTKYDNKGNIIQEGLTMQPSGQGHHWIREVLVRQLGGTPYSADNRTVLYYQTAPETLKVYTDLITKDKVGYPGFLNDDVTAFRSLKAAMTIDGSFRLGTFRPLHNLNWGVTELPSMNGVKSNFASFWAHAITTNATGDKLDASIKFLKFITSEYAQTLWLEQVGELPANPNVAAAYYDHPEFGPFLKGLEYAHATFFVDESGQRQVLMDAVDKVWILGMDPIKAFEEAAAEDQAIIDEFWSRVE